MPAYLIHILILGGYIMRCYSLFIFSIIATIAVSTSTHVNAQEQERSTVERKILTPIDRNALISAEQERQKNIERPTALQFAEAESVAFTLANSGVWEDVDGGRTWTLSLFSQDALSMSLHLSDISLPEGVTLTVADPAGEVVQGPYDGSNISARGRLFTALVEGEEIVLRVFVPDNAAEPALRINAVNRGFLPFGSNSPFKSGPCNNDVVCPEGVSWANQIRSVARYTINGTGLCTGTMINNTALDFTPYFLSANHCGVSSANDDTLVMYWNFESPTCGQLGGGSLTDNQSGATFRAANTSSDFLLVELIALPDPAWNVFYSGWDATGVAAISTVGIHHPAGDEKAISFNTNPVTSTNYGSSTIIADANFWRVDDWEDGTTEPGSSGSCIWDANSGLCVGTLTGGAASCTAPNDSDWYGKFSSSWTGNGTNATRLSNWLDTGNTGIVTLNGDPHLLTLDGVRYDFQGAGEFVALKDADGTEIQVRQKAISTTFVPGANPYHGLKTCVSLNSAVAARVGKHRITYQPLIRDNEIDPERMMLRVDGKPVELNNEKLSLREGGMIIPTDQEGGLLIEYPDKYALTVVPKFWDSQQTWYLNVSLVRRPVVSSGGISPVANPVGIGGLNAPIDPASWLPALPDGTLFGSMPASIEDRFVVLYEKFGEAWRVTDTTSLFDYESGQSTSDFTDRRWPRPESDSSCPVENQEPVEKPLPLAVAQDICGDIIDKDERENCIFDAMIMGEGGDVGRTYARSARLVKNAVAVSEKLAPVTKEQTFFPQITPDVPGLK